LEPALLRIFFPPRDFSQRRGFRRNPFPFRVGDYIGQKQLDGGRTFVTEFERVRRLFYKEEADFLRKSSFNKRGGEK